MNNSFPSYQSFQFPTQLLLAFFPIPILHITVVNNLVSKTQSWIPIKLSMDILLGYASISMPWILAWRWSLTRSRVFTAPSMICKFHCQSGKMMWRSRWGPAFVILSTPPRVVFTHTHLQVNGTNNKPNPLFSVWHLTPSRRVWAANHSLHTLERNTRFRPLANFVEWISLPLMARIQNSRLLGVWIILRCIMSRPNLSF